jgi:hypothetical protein
VLCLSCSTPLTKDVQSPATRTSAAHCGGKAPTHTYVASALPRALYMRLELRQDGKSPLMCAVKCL